MGWARALFDYSGGSDMELSFSAGDMIETLSNEPVDDWLEGVLSSTGKQGYFPFNYVEIVEDAPAAVEAPPPMAPKPEPQPVAQAVPVSNALTATVVYEFEGQGESELSAHDGDIVTVINKDEGEGWCLVSLNGVEGLFPSGYLEFNEPASGGGGGGGGGSAAPASYNDFSSGGADASSSTMLDDHEDDLPFVDVFAEVDQRLSVKNLTGHDTEKYTIGARQWEGVEEPYTVIMAETDKKKKFGGLKHFTSYTITTSSKDLTVSRRYKHFDWLRQQMVEKFPLIAVPSLPAKQYGGRFQSDFVNQRRRDLASFLNRCARHPVIRSSPVFVHFLMAANESTWKRGKRVAEKDSARGPYFFRNCIATELPPKEADAEVARFRSALKFLDKHFKQVDRSTESLYHSAEQFAKVLEHYADVLQTTAKGEEAMGGLCWMSDCVQSEDLMKVFHQFGEVIKSETESQRLTLVDTREELAHLMRDYIAMIPHLQDILKVRESAMYTYMTAYSKSVKAGRAMTQEEDKKLNRMKSRCDIITSVFLAEMDHFHACLISDMKAQIRSHVQAQIDYHKKMTAEWEALASQIDTSKMTETVAPIITKLDG